MMDSEFIVREDMRVPHRRSTSTQIDDKNAGGIHSILPRFCKVASQVLCIYMVLPLFL